MPCLPSAQREKVKIKMEQLAEKVRRAPNDNGSYEVQGKADEIPRGDCSALPLTGCSFSGGSWED